MLQPPAGFPTLRPLVAVLAFAAAGLCAAAVAADVVIRQAYVAGGNAGAVYANDFVAAGAQATVPLQVSGTVGVGSYAVAVRFGNDDASHSALCPVDIAVTAPAARVRIRDIQGRAHRSSLEGRAVSGVAGIVTAVKGNGFYLQDPAPDADPATSEAIFVFTSVAPAVAVGDELRVSGVVQEFRPGGSGGVNNLTTTEIAGSPSVTRVSANNPLPAPVAIGVDRMVPGKAIDDDAAGDVETGGSFDAAADGIDFWESLEGMRVMLPDAVAVGPTSRFGEIPALAGGSGVPRTPRGGIAIAADDFNPERILLDDDILAPMPAANVGDLLGNVTGVLDYGFGTFKLLATEPVAVSDQRLAAETTVLAGGAGRLTVASFNVENLDANDPAAKFEALAAQIVTNLRSPDILGLMEIQDDNGPMNDGVVSARATFDRLVAAIAAAGGPAYGYRAVDPVDDQDGGEPGGNIRQGFLFNPARVAFVDRAAAGDPSVTALAVTDGPDGPRLSHSPGRIDPLNGAFAASRKPLAGEFLFNGRRLFAIANHFNSKGGDQPLFGRFQPPQRPSEAWRTQQAAVVAGFVAQILERDPGAAVVVLGDLNDFEFAPSLASLRTVGKLADLVQTLPPEERYTYVFEGNSQALDHILASPSLAAVAEYDVVHVNAEFAVQQSDHDPVVARFALGAALEDVTASFDIALSGLRCNRGPQTYSGTVTLTNRGPSISRPLQVVLEGLPTGVTLTNADGTVGGAPAIWICSSTLPSPACRGPPPRYGDWRGRAPPAWRKSWETRRWGRHPLSWAMPGSPTCGPCRWISAAASASRWPSAVPGRVPHRGTGCSSPLPSTPRSWTWTTASFSPRIRRPRCCGWISFPAAGWRWI